MTTYGDWEEACEQSLTQRAVASIIVTHEGKTLRAEIIKSKYKDGIIYYRHSAVPIRKATTAEVDRARKWKPL